MYSVRVVYSVVCEGVIVGRRWFVTLSWYCFPSFLEVCFSFLFVGTKHPLGFQEINGRRKLTDDGE